MSIYSKETILEILAEMKYFNKQITEVGFKTDRPQLLKAIESHFGSLDNALSQVTPIKVQPRKMTKREKIYTKLVH
ncbi:hypothetical protein [Bacillus pseudomycoides]|uniref:hypothetical protein n=1 Tax=Bacillus pseudomycoides TaxID=64104 RepID=UPI000BF56558|nr:hypothetical protein [Bacillus pseudomycoides]PGC41918.1 hypothetical protein COM18_09695 [Bacillus pseudomycoides]